MKTLKEQFVGGDVKKQSTQSHIHTLLDIYIMYF